MRTFVRYKHHSRRVWVQAEGKGKHRLRCLCWYCDRFEPGWSLRAVLKCVRAKILYLFCVVFGMTTPVHECPRWVAKGELETWEVYGTPVMARVEDPRNG